MIWLLLKREITLGSYFILRCVFSASILAQSAWAEPNKAISPAELKKALTFYQSIAQLDVDFQQTKSLKDIKLDLNSEGHLTLKLPDQVEWKILKPQPMTVNLEQEKITIHNGAELQTFSQKENPSAKDRKGFATMLSWLKLDAGEISSQFDVQEAKPRDYIFVPKDPKGAMFKSLEMNMGKEGHVETLVFEEASGDEIRIHFKKPKVIYRK
jgi:hypothetical protein